MILRMPDASHPDVVKLEAWFARLPEEYKRWRAAGDAAAVRWEWYSDDAFDLRPLHYERDLRKPGRRLPERPSTDTDVHGIGFDAEDRPVVFREYTGVLDGELYYETFRDYGADVVTEAHFYADGNPIYLHQYQFDAGLIRSALIAATGGGGSEQYSYTGGQVTRVDITYGAREDGELSPLEPHQVINAEFDAAGLVRLEVDWVGQETELKYERPPADFTVEQACQTMHRELVTQVPAAVRELGIDEPAYCVALAYFPEDPLDIMVYVGAADEREDGSDIWSPADMGADTMPDLSAVADTMRLLAQELTLAEDWERARDLLCAVAAELNTQDWSQVLPVTDDFVVYAVDFELTDLDNNLPACVPEHRLAMLYERDRISDTDD